MPVSKKKFEPYDRAKRGSRTGTVVNVHDHKDAAVKRLTVLADDKPRSHGAELWPIEDCARLPRAGRACPRCGADHGVFYCPEGGDTFGLHAPDPERTEPDMGENSPEQNIDNVEGDVVNEAPATESTTPSETPDSNGDTTGDDAQQDTGALQE